MPGRNPHRYQHLLRQQYRNQFLSQIGVLHGTAVRQFQNAFGDSQFVYSLGYTVRTQAFAGQHYTDALLSKGVGLLATQQLNILLSQTRDTTAQRLTEHLRNIRQPLNRQLNQPPAKQRGVDSLQRTITGLEQQLVLRLPEYGQDFEALRV